jgi:hypothetical protein
MHTKPEGVGPASSLGYIAQHVAGTGATAGHCSKRMRQTQMQSRLTTQRPGALVAGQPLEGYSDQHVHERKQKQGDGGASPSDP